MNVRIFLYIDCSDLGRDLVPVVTEFKSSVEFQTGKPQGHVLPECERPLRQDTETKVPDPFDIYEFISVHRDQLEAGLTIPLFENHPDTQFDITLTGGPTPPSSFQSHKELWLCVLDGRAVVNVGDSGDQVPDRGYCGIVPTGQAFTVATEKGSVILMVNYD